MKHGRFLSNTHDHRKANAKMYPTYSFHARDCGQAAMDAEWQHHLDWINANVIDRPKATEKYTVGQLEANDLIGIYAPEGK